jgi:FdhD protein
MRREQRWFDDTGGLHAAALFDLDGSALIVREDVGRHNAVDKVVGWAVQQGRLPLSDTALAVSGRASFEIVQKAAVAGVAIVVAVSAPSSLAMSAADELGMTLIGFTRGERCNVYTHPERVAAAGD